ncbi:zinc finger protein Helios-like isoform X2 [Anguilla rostrata]
METEAADGCPASNGPCSPTEEHARMLVDLSVTMPTRLHPQPPDSPSVPTVKQEEGGEEEGEKNGLEEAGRSVEEVSGLDEPSTDSPNNVQDGDPQTVGSCDTGTRLPNAGDERPFHCSQCGVSFTQKGNLLRHVKLHSGEKPFKCPFCSYACRRRDALTGHLRTHSVGKPHKCNLCGRSYKQRASLEEHKERCHSYMQRVNANSAPNSGPYQAEESLKEQQPLMDAVSIASFDRPPVIERLQGNVGKRKSTTPQKFVGEKLMHYGYPEQPYDMALKYDKEAELMQAQIMDPTISSGVAYLGADPMRPLLHHPALTMINPLFPQNYSLGPRDAPLPPPPPPELPPSSNGPLSLVRPKHPLARHGESPSNSRPGSTGSERGSPPERAGQRLNHTPWAGSSLAHHRKEAAEPGEQEAASDRAEGIRVFSREGRELRAFRCRHCRVLYLDHVMFTIHMGCHGYRDPLECNICGHRSEDRYEFSSHIVRGEHTFQ